MLIEIPCEILDSLPACDEEHITALENLATARREGKHLIVGKHSTMKELAHWGQLTPRASELYRQASNNATQEMGLAGRLHTIVKVACDGVAPRLDMLGSRQVIVLPLRHFSDSGSIQPTRLLGENVVDARLYKILAEYYGLHPDLRRLKVSVELDHGGGSSTYKVYTHLQNNSQGFCVCIVDSDQQSPASPLGQTAKNVAVVDSDDNPRIQYHAIGCRTAENLLPITVIDQVSSSSMGASIPARVNLFKFLRDIVCTDESEARLWIRLKGNSDLRMAELFAIDVTQPHFLCWKNWRNKIAGLVSAYHQCVASKVCQQGSACKCDVVQGCSDLLGDCVEEMETMTRHKLSESIANDEHLRGQWEIIGEITFSWGCAKARNVT